MGVSGFRLSQAARTVVRSGGRAGYAASMGWSLGLELVLTDDLATNQMLRRHVVFGKVGGNNPPAENM
eukprot:8060240-Alexandrium_andersonii.AAC.1